MLSLSTKEGWEKMSLSGTSRRGKNPVEWKISIKHERKTQYPYNKDYECEACEYARKLQIYILEILGNVFFTVHIICVKEIRERVNQKNKGSKSNNR